MTARPGPDRRGPAGRLLRVAGREPGDLGLALRTFRPALAGQRRRVAAAVALSLTTTGLELAKPWPVGWVVDHLTATAAAATPTTPAVVPGLTPIALIALVALAIPVLLGLASERLDLVTAKVGKLATIRIRSSVFEHLQRMDLAQHQQHYSGELLIRLMGDVNNVRDLLFPSWLKLLSSASILVGGSLVFALVDWRLFVVALVPLPLLWVTVDRASTAIKQAAGRQRRKEGAIAATASESLRRVGLIKAFAAEERTTEAFRSSADKAERATMAAARQSARMVRLTEILTGGGVALVLLLGAARVRAGLLSTGELVLAISYTRTIYKPIRRLTEERARIAKATACALRIIDVLDKPVEVPDRGEPVHRLDGDIELFDVAHRYPDGRPSLDGLTVRIPAGSLVAVTGENGTGKSTLLALLLRLYQPERGAISIGGRPIQRLRLAEYRERIAYVPQDLALFGGTIRDNIAFGRPGATEHEILTAADAALLTPVLAELPDGLDTVLDEDGASLSGGQARRVMLARAALRDASVLLLDEPLSGLDPDARVTVARAIGGIAAGRTTLVVHHGDLAELAPDHLIVLDRRPPPRPRLAVVGR